MRIGCSKGTIIQVTSIELPMEGEGKNTVISLENNGETIEGDENLLKHATEYYSNLFGPEVEHRIQIDQSLWNELEQVSELDNENLCKPFSEQEIKEALFQMEKHKATGSNKIPIEFFQICWDIVKYDIIQLFDLFHKEKTNISRINYGVITLLPKVTDAARI
jgi:hypothetical protein